MRLLHRTAIALAGLALLCSAAIAQTTGFTHFGVEEGLPRSESFVLEQDNQGNLWVGTMAGLARFNGTSFITYTSQHGLAHEWVSCGLKDKTGNIWFGHFTGQVSIFNRERQQIEALEFGQYGDFNPITDIFESKAGVLWFGTAGGGIFSYDSDRQTITDYAPEVGIREASVEAIAEDAVGNLWFGTNQGVAILDAGSDGQNPASWHFLDQQSGLAGAAVTCIENVGTNQMWIGTAEAGITIVNINAGFSTSNLAGASKTQLTAENGLSSNHVTSLYLDQAQTVWVGTRESGIFRYTIASDGPHPIKGYSTTHGLNYNKINAIFEDREGNIWIATDLGINRYKNDKFLVYEESDGLAHNIVWSLLEDRSGGIWMGTNAGVTQLRFEPDPETGRPFITQSYTTADGLSSDVVLALHEEQDGTMWVGTNGMGACRLKPNASTWEVFTAEDGLSGNIVFSITEDEQGRIWFGTRGGAARYDNSTNTFRRFDERDGLGGNNVYTIYRDSKNSLWFGILGGYLSRYRNGEFKAYDESFGIKQRFIQSIAEDQSGNLWFGANRGGIYRYDGTNFKFFSLEDETDPGKPHYIPYSVTSDNAGNIWIGTSRGIARLDQQSGAFTHYGEREGFLGVETNPNAIARDRAGNLWFGTIMGAVRFTPEEDTPNAVEPITTISGVRVFHEPVEWPEDNQFPFGQNHLTFDFIGVTLSAADKVRYQYKLENFDADWSPVGTSKQAVYANLPPGSYTFKVRSANEDGVWNAEPVAYRFEVLAPFWQERWFFWLCVAVVLITLFVYVRARAKKLRLLQHRLEQQMRDSEATIAMKNRNLEENETYARSILDAIAQSSGNISVPGFQSIVLFEPRRPAAGDFVRLVQQKDRWVMAVADVEAENSSGRLLSLLGYSALSTLFDRSNATHPAELLSQLSDQLAKSAATSSVSTADRLKMSVLSFTESSSDVDLCGAGIDCWVCQAGKVTKIEGGHKALNLHDSANHKPFANKRVKMQPGDILYVVTDGYIKQTGENSGVAFSAERLEELLQEVANLPLRDQELILRERLKGWQGEFAQTDDVLIIALMA